MEISAANLNALFTGFDTIFQKGFEDPDLEIWFEKISTVTRSTSRQGFYPWLGRTSRFREWLGDRVVQALQAHGYTIVNKTFEDTVGVLREDVEDDNYGVYAPVIEELGMDSKMHPDQLIFGVLKAAVANIDNPSGAAITIGDISVSVPIAYDDKTFFSASHPYGPANKASEDGTYSNVDTGGSGTYWVLLNCARPIRPTIFQMRREYAVTRMNSLTDEAVFNRREFRYGVDARCNAGVGLPQLAYASNQDLANPANFGKAIAAMRGIKNDNGLPFGSWNGPSTKKFLIVAPDREEVAKQLLHNTFGAIAGAAGAIAGVPGSNIYLNECSLIVTPYLS